MRDVRLQINKNAERFEAVFGSCQLSKHLVRYEMKGFVGVTDNDWSGNGLRRKAYGSGHQEARDR